MLVVFINMEDAATKFKTLTPFFMIGVLIVVTADVRGRVVCSEDSGRSRRPHGAQRLRCRAHSIRESRPRRILQQGLALQFAGAGSSAFGSGTSKALGGGGSVVFADEAAFGGGSSAFDVGGSSTFGGG